MSDQDDATVEAQSPLADSGTPKKSLEGSDGGEKKGLRLSRSKGSVEEISASPKAKKKASKKLSDISSKSIKKLSVTQLLQDNAVAMALFVNQAKADEEDVGIAMASIFYSLPQGVRLTSYCFYRELEATDDPTLLLRGSGVNTRLLSTFARLSGYSYLKQFIGPFIQNLIRNKKPLEINPAKLLEEESVEENQKNLMDVCTELVQTIKSSIAEISWSTIEICNNIYDNTETKFPNWGNRAICGFFVLRFICPALTMPEKYDLLKDCSVDLRRKLILVAKVIQAIFNQTVEDKEEWMQPVTPFVTAQAPEVAALCEALRQRWQNEKDGGAKAIGRLQPLPKVALKTASQLLKYFVNKHLDSFKQACQDCISQSSLQGEAELLRAVLREAELLGQEPAGVGAREGGEHFQAWLQTLKARGSSLTHDSDVYADLLAAPADPDDYDLCIVRVTSESKTTKILTTPRDALTVDWLHRAVKEAFKKVERVEYLKDGERTVLNKVSWVDFQRSAVIRGGTAEYRLFLLRKSAPALNKYLEKL